MAHDFTYRRRVEFAETDTAGVAHFSAFFRWMEEAEHAFYRSLGGSAYRWTPDRVEGMPRVSASCEYFRPVRYADELEVRLVVREKTARAIGYEVVFSLTASSEPDREETLPAGVAPSAPPEPASGVVARGTMRVIHTARPHGAREWKATELPAVLREGIEVAPAVGGARDSRAAGRTGREGASP